MPFLLLLKLELSFFFFFFDARKLESSCYIQSHLNPTCLQKKLHEPIKILKIDKTNSN